MDVYLETENILGYNVTIYDVVHLLMMCSNLPQ